MLLPTGSDGSVLLLSARDVRQAIDAATLIDAIDASLREGSSGRAHGAAAHQAVARRYERPPHCHAGISRSHVLATKTVALFPRNPARGLPHIIGIVVLHDADTGAPLAIIEGATVTDLRTAAASVVATRALVGRAPRVLALIGAGAQARALRRGRTWSSSAACTTSLMSASVPRISDSAERLARDVALSLPGRIRALADAEAALRGAALIVTATTAVEPVLHGAWLDPGTHVCAVGAATLKHREIEAMSWPARRSSPSTSAMPRSPRRATSSPR